jgi:hypothetical protein
LIEAGEGFINAGIDRHGGISDKKDGRAGMEVVVDVLPFVGLVP